MPNVPDLTFEAWKVHCVWSDEAGYNRASFDEFRKGTDDLQSVDGAFYAGFVAGYQHAKQLFDKSQPELPLN